MIIILHDNRVKASRDFVSANSEGYEIIDFGSEADAGKVAAYRLSPCPPVPAFPSVVDTEKQKLCREPATMEFALSGLSEVKEILRSQIIERLEAIPTETGSKFDDAFAALSQDAKAMFKWNSMIQIKIDNPQVTGLLQAIGVDPSLILY